MRVTAAIPFLALLVITAILYGADADAATTRKTITMPSGSSILSSGSGVLSGSVLDITMPSVEYIPNASTESRALATMGKGVAIAESGLISAVKTGLKANAASLATSAAIAALAAGVGWIIDEGGKIQKIATTTPSDVLPGDAYWQGSGYYSTPSNSPQPFADAFAAYWAQANGSTTCSYDSSDMFTCTATLPNGATPSAYAQLVGNTCTSPRVFKDHSCVISSGATDLVDSDYNLIDGFVKGKDGVWQKGLVSDLCAGSDADKCLANMGATSLVTGPSTITLPDVSTTTTTTNPDGTTSTKTDTTKTTYGLDYGTGYVDMTPSSTTTTSTSTKDGTGTVTSTTSSTSTTTTTTTGTPADEPSYDFVNPDYPTVDPFYTQKYPTGLQGVWDKRKLELMDSSFLTFLNGFVPSFSGTCPTFGLSFNIMAHANFGYVSFSSLCYIFDFIKVIMLVTAMFTCRAIIFGG